MRKRSDGKYKTTCSKCGKPIEESRKGRQRYCKGCHAEHMRNTRPKHSELNPEARKKANARAYLKTYIRRGKIKKQPCEICKDPNSEAHHEDYDKPLVVIWLCRKHHLEHHQNISNANNAGVLSCEN